ncbi:uncharacterized protein [Epargyreus clarus]|uniref:uncharacterized protein n=1 Tax=Epargyreus clarus TaxID=520877 RepID=UPI003C2FAAC2
MVPNPVDTSFNHGIESGPDRKGARPLPAEVSTGRYILQFVQSTLNLIAYLLVGVVVGICLLFSYRNGTTLNSTNMHIVLCVLGYQLLMAVAILSLTSESGFSASLSLRDKRRIHTVLQVIGSALAIAGSFVMSVAKNVNFNTIHGKTALVAMVFTIVCLVNGVTSLYAYEMRKCLPGNLSKLTHICFGIVAFVMATVSLCYGFDKNSFRNWATNEFTIVIIVFTGYQCKMPPNIVDPPFNPDVESVPDNRKETNVLTASVQMSQGKYVLKIFTTSLNLLAYLLIGVTVGISLLFSFSNGLPLGSTAMHIVLCVMGYQLLMAVAILSLSPNNGWSAFLTLRDKRRVHTVLQVMGSALAISGSFIKILNKEVHWNSLHGKYGLVALVFTTVSLVNGLSSLYAFEWRRCLPGNLSKLTHICFGIVAYATSSVSLCYGFDKVFFRAWATEAFATTLIAFTGIITFIVIFNPIITFFSKSMNIIKK